MKSWFQLAVTAAAMLASGLAPAQLAPKAQGAVESRLEARKVVTAADGKETFAAANTAKPGDVIEYVATYRNTTKQPVRNLQATLPIPADMELLQGSQKPAAATASTDGTTFAPMPLRRKATKAGAQGDELVPLRDYRALRWSTPELAGEKVFSVSARARVSDDRAATGPPAAGTAGTK